MSGICVYLYVFLIISCLPSKCSWSEVQLLNTMLVNETQLLASRGCRLALLSERKKDNPTSPSSQSCSPLSNSADTSEAPSTLLESVLK